MTGIATDIVDVYVFRRLNARVQFLLLQRRHDVPMAQTWQAFHHEIARDQTAPEAARTALHTLAGLEIDRYYSADFVNQFYDEGRDVVVLAPVLAVTVKSQTAVTLADDFQDAGWFDRDEATARLPFSGQRWAVRHIDEIMGIGEAEAELYRFEPAARPAAHESGTVEPASDSASALVDGQDDELGLEPPAETGMSPESSDADDPDGDGDSTDRAPTDIRHASRQD